MSEKDFIDAILLGLTIWSGTIAWALYWQKQDRNNQQ